MEQLSLIVEGEEDVRFLQDFIDFHFAQKIDKNFFIIVGGKSETIHLSSTKIQTSTDSGKLNILIFDADDTDYESTLGNVNKAAQKLSLKIDSIFLFPDHKFTGNLEGLLKSSVASGNERLFKCIDDYATCKSALSLQKSRVIDEKERLRIYHGSFESGSAQGSKRSYLDTVIWDLNSPTLKALREFLTGFFN